MGNVFIIMGVSGCGKSTIGKGLADKLDGIYIEGDELHPQANIDKMSSGEPLSDDDRWPWFDLIVSETQQQLKQYGKVFLGCSALKLIYRDYLFQNFPDVCRIIHLAGSYETIQNRMQSREHFMPPKLLQSQFDTLELPEYDSNTCLSLAIDQPVETMLAKATNWI